MRTEPIDNYVLWGSHGPTTGGAYIKIMEGTDEECQREKKRRRAAGWTELCTKWKAQKELARALPALAPHHSPTEHARASARIVADIGGAE